MTYAPHSLAYPRHVPQLAGTLMSSVEALWFEPGSVTLRSWGKRAEGTYQMIDFVIGRSRIDEQR
jgi:hypothetical protein